MKNQNKNRNKSSRSRTRRLPRLSKKSTKQSNSVVSNPPVVRYTPDVYGFPDRLLTKLRYADVLTAVSTSGALNTYIFRWNSTFDPDLSGTGHQPLYRDTYASVYDQYSVVRAWARVRFDNTSTSVGFVIGCVTDDDASPSTTFQTLMEQSHGLDSTLTALAGSHSSHEFTLTWDASKVLNIDPFSSETYKTAVGSNPTEISSLVMWSKPIDGSSTATCLITVELIQEVLWTELSTPTQS